MTRGFAELCRAAFVIARRDFVATVFSRTFALFLAAPLFPVLFGGAYYLLNGGTAAPPPPVRVAVIASAQVAAPIEAARSRLEAGGLGGDLPVLTASRPSGPVGPQARELLDEGAAGVLVPGDQPRLFGAPDDVAALRTPLGLLLDDAARAAALGDGGLARRSTLAVEPVARPAAPVDRSGFAHTAQSVLFGLTLLLASVLLSNMTEERANKVVEVLAAAVPVRAIFLGKLFSMLAISLVGLCVWGSLGAVGIVALAQGAGPAPAVGWGAFVLLAFAYFTMNYLLFGGAFLGIGSQASSIRQVQSLGMPVAFVQLAVLGFAGTAAGAPDSAIGHAAMIFPWSSPLSMLALAAQRPQLWPHLLALGWQLLWVALTVVASAALFRRNVLKSGGGAPARPARR